MSTFEDVKESLQNALRVGFKAKKGDRAEKMDKTFRSLNLSEMDRRGLIDQSMRDMVMRVATEGATLATLQSYVSYSIELSHEDCCSSSLPVILLSDMFDTSTLGKCELMFGYVEDKVSVWKEDLFFGACKNNLLRMCNDLLRRLSRSQNTVFRGRILLFLAKFFPVSERSGLNIVSEFNIDSGADNIDESAKIDDFEEMDGVENSEGETQPLRVDFNLYTKFLTLQDLCRSPNQCYNNVRWRVLVNSATDVLTAFRNFKLDDETYTGRPAAEHLAEVTCPMFFAKYLTNPKLLELQLSDPKFRRSLLIQLLVLMQYLTSPVKFKLDSYELKPEQADWVKQQVTTIYDLLAETPGNSKSFAESVRHLMKREELWNNWKNEGCPEFKIPAMLEETEEPKQRARPKKRRIDELLKDATAHNKYYMGHTELTRLWNIDANNLNACRTKERNFLPEIDEYFAECIMQMDPAAAVEAEYKKVKDPNFGWRALRLLSQRSPGFFYYTNIPGDSLPNYIEASLKRMARDRPTTDTTKQEPEEEDEGETEVLLKQEGEERETKKAGEESAEKSRDSKVTAEMAVAIAKLTAEHWRKIAPKLGFENSDVKVMESSGETDLRRCEDMLKVWAEEDPDATCENLAYILEGLELVEAAAILKPQLTTD